MKNYRNMLVALCLMACASMTMAADTNLAQAAESDQTLDAPAAVKTSAQAPAEPSTTPAEASTNAATATPATPATTTAASSEQAALQATIRSVKGIVQYRTADDQPWQKVQAGQTLDVGVEFRTGPRSAVTFHLPPDQLITLDRLGTLKLLDALNNEDKSRATTELGMRYGRTRYQVEGSQGVEHNATIRSPNATLAIRGTQDVTLTDQGPGPASATTRNTRVYFRSKGSPTQVVFGSNDDNSTQVVNAGENGPAENRILNRVVDASAFQARSQREFQILNDFELYNGPSLTNQGIRNIVNTPGATPDSNPSDGCNDCLGR